MNCIVCANISSSTLLEEFIGKSSSLNLVGTFSDSASLKDKLLKKHDIDLIFLDVDTPGLDIFDFVKSLDNQANIIKLLNDFIINGLSPGCFINVVFNKNCHDHTSGYSKINLFDG